MARSDGSIRILPGDRTGRFGDALGFPAGNDVMQATAGDVNGDGVPDLLAAGVTVGHAEVLLDRLEVARDLNLRSVGFHHPANGVDVRPEAGLERLIR